MADEFQYVKLPDGSYGKFPASASDDQIRTVLASQFPKEFAAAKAGSALPASSMANIALRPPLMNGQGMQESTLGKLYRQQADVASAIGQGAKSVGQVAAGPAIGEVAALPDQIKSAIAVARGSRPQPVSPKDLIANLAGVNKQALQQASQENNPASIGGQMAGPLAAAALGSYAGVQMKRAAIPNLERGGMAIGQAEKVAAKVPVDPNSAGGVILEAQKLQEAGQTMPRVMQRFIQRVSDPNKGPLTFDEARVYLKTAGRLSAAENLHITPEMNRMLVRFTNNLREATAAAADRAGVGDVYRGGVNEVRQAARLRDALLGAKEYAGSEIKKALPWLGAAYVAGKALGYKPDRGH